MRLALIITFLFAGCASSRHSSVTPQVEEPNREDVVREAVLILRQAEIHNLSGSKNHLLGAYDAIFIGAIQRRWYKLIEGNKIRNRGKVVVEFRLHSDGQVTKYRVIEDELNGSVSALCQQAVLDPAPYVPFSAELLQSLGKDYRDVRFTFHVKE